MSQHTSQEHTPSCRMLRAEAPLGAEAMTPEKNRRVARRSSQLRARHYTLTSHTGHRVPTLRYWVPGLAGLTGMLLLLLGGTLLSHAAASPDEQPSLVRGLTSRLWYPEWNSQAATP